MYDTIAHAYAGVAAYTNTRKTTLYFFYRSKSFNL